MLLKITGYQVLDFQTDSGERFKGVKLHGIEQDVVQEGLTGEKVNTVTIKDEYAVMAMLPPLEVGKVLAIGFKKGSNMPEFIFPAPSGKQKMADVFPG